MVDLMPCASHPHCPPKQVCDWCQNYEWQVATPPATQAMDELVAESERLGLYPATQADDALVTDMAPLLDEVFGEPCSYELAGKIYRAILPILHRREAAAHAAGRAAERAEVVAWLRNGAQWDDPVPTLESYENIANAAAIERGQHGSKGDE
jgi:hypothetical protein